MALLGVLVALSAGATLALAAGARRAGTTLDRYVDAVDPADVLVDTGNEPSAELLASITADPRVVRVDRNETALLAPEPMMPGEHAFLVVTPRGASIFGDLVLVAGRLYGGDATDEIVVNERAATTSGFHVGQRVNLDTLPCFDGCRPQPVGPATIVGVVRLPTDVSADPSIPGLAFGSPSIVGGAWRDLYRPASWTGVHLRDRAEVDAFVAELSPRVEDGEVSGVVSSVAVIERASRMQRNALVAAAAVVGVAGLLVVAQAVGRHLAGRTADGQVLAALGMRPVERWWGATLAVIPALVAGVLVGAGLAGLGSGLFPLGMAGRTEVSSGIHPDLTVLAVGGVAFLLALFLITALVAARWVRPAPSAGGPSKSFAPMAVASHLRPVPAIGSRFALQRGDGRTRLPVMATMVVLVVTTAVAVGALVVRWSLDQLVTTPARFGQGWDLRVAVPDDSVRAAGEQLRADSRVQALAVGSIGEVNVTKGDGAAVQIPALGMESLDGPLGVAVLAGRSPQGPHEIALGSATMANLGVSVGDHMTVSGPCGSFEAEVVGRVILPIVGSGYDDAGSLVPLGSFQQVCAQQLIANADADSFALVRARTGHDGVGLARDWTAEGQYVRPLPKPTSIAGLEDIRPVPAVVAVLVGVLAAAAAGHALVLAVRRRRGDLAVLRTMGFTPRQAGGVIRWQAIVLVAVALVLGVPAGLVLGRVVWAAIAEPANVLVRADVPVAGLGAWAAAATVVALTLSLWPARRAARLRPAEALRSE